MVNERKYIYLEKIMKKVPILADGMNWTWQFDGFSFIIPSEIERILVYSLYIGHSDWDFLKVVKQYLPNEMVDNTDLKILQSSFKDLHPLSDIQEYDIGMVPEYADSITGLWLYGDRKNYNIVVTLDDERELLSRLRNATPWNNCMSLLTNSVSRRYTIDFDDSIMESALVSFLIQHGIDPVIVRQKDEKYFKSSVKERIKEIKDNYNAISEIADQEKGMWISCDGKIKGFWITKEDERIMLSRLNDKMLWQDLKAHLCLVSARYALNLNNSEKDSAIANFLMQHGINPDTLKRKNDEYYNAIVKENGSSKNKTENNRSENNKFTKRMIPAAIVYPILMATTIFLWVITLYGSNYDSDIGWFLLAFLFGIGGAAVRDESGIFMIKGWYISLIVFYVGSIIASITGIVLEGAGELVSYVALVLSLAYVIALFGFQTDGRHLYFFDGNSNRWRRLNGKE